MCYVLLGHYHRLPSRKERIQLFFFFSKGLLQSKSLLFAAYNMYLPRVQVGQGGVTSSGHLIYVIRNGSLKKKKRSNNMFKEFVKT